MSDTLAALAAETAADPAVDLAPVGDPVVPASEFQLQPEGEAEGGFDIMNMPLMGVLPKRNYRVVAHKIEQAKSKKSGNNMLVLDFEVLAPAELVINDVKHVTAGTKFKAWFVWSMNSNLQPSLQALQRGFGIPARKVKDMAEMERFVTAYMLANGVGSTFLWELWTEPQYKRAALTAIEIANGKDPEDAPELKDENGNKLLERHEVIRNWTGIVGDFKRFTAGMSF